jgi:hypothetical protein
VKSKKTTIKPEPKDKQPQPVIQAIDDKTLESASGGGFVCASGCACTNL